MDLARSIAVRLVGAAGLGPQWFDHHLKPVYKNATSLHGLTEESSNPFDRAREACVEHGAPVEIDLEGLLCHDLLTFAAFRNYAAHHDCLDDRMFFDGWARPAIEATLTLTVLLLGAVEHSPEVS